MARATKNKTIKVAVYISGGVCQGCRATAPNVEIELFDRDNAEEETNDLDAWERDYEAYPHPVY